ncbi:MAG: hypothetical protein ABI593_11315 [Betaproteobacteria bacterium]
MNRVVILLVAASLFGAWNWWSSERHVRVPPGIVAAAEPVQRELDVPAVFSAKDHRFHVRAQYTITARVLRKEIYRIDGGASLAPVDLGLGWGPMSDTRIVDQLEFSQMGRFLFWRPTDWTTFPLTPRDTIAHAAQVHAIPADDDVERRLRRLRPGQVVTLTGYLVDVRGPGGFSWNTSLRRDDTGDGACELMWIERVSID